MRRLYTKQHRFYCGIDLHARLLAICIVDHQTNDVVVRTQIPDDPKLLLDLLALYRPDVVVAVECLFAWYWVADLCRRENIPFVLGHALYMKAIHGGKAKNDDIDAESFCGGNCPCRRCSTCSASRRPRGAVRTCAAGVRCTARRRPVAAASPLTWRSTAGVASAAAPAATPWTSTWRSASCRSTKAPSSCALGCT